MDDDTSRLPAPARTVLEQLLREQDRTYDESAVWFEQVARGLGERCSITARHLRRLASGERQGTTPATRRVLQAMFGQPLHELLAPPATSMDRPDAPLSLAPRGTGSIDLNDKEILRMAAERARRFTLTASSTNLHGESLDQLHDDVAGLAVAYQQQPASQFLAPLVETQDVLFGLLEGRQAPAHTRHLLMLASVTGGVLAKISHDLGDAHLALTQSRTAFLCADNADHNGLRAWIRGLQSLIAYWAGRPLDAVRYAQEGAAFGARGTASAWLPISEARAWAALGNDTATREAIDRATEAREHIDPDDVDELGGLCTFTPQRQLYYAADALAWLPQQARTAERAASEAVTAYADPGSEGWSYSDAAGAATNLATARLGRGDVEGAAEAVNPVLDLPAEQRIHGVVTSVDRVRRALVGVPSTPGVTALQEQIELYTATPAKAVLPR